MYKAKVYIMVVCFFASMTAAPASFAGTKGHEAGKDARHGEDMAKKKEQMYKELGLSDTQKQELKAHKDAFREQGKALREAKREKMQALKQAVQAEILDQAAVDALTSEVAALQTQMLTHRIQGLLAVRGILTPEQFKKFIEKMKHHRERGARKDGAREHKGWRDSKGCCGKKQK